MIRIQRVSWCGNGLAVGLGASASASSGGEVLALLASRAVALLWVRIGLLLALLDSFFVSVAE